jgi:TRAP-type C4-dicarboxylate transport system permease small subunit
MISFVFSVFFGAALALKNSEHLQVDLLDKAPETLRKTAKALEMLIVGIMIVVLIIYGGLLVQNNFGSGKILGILPIKMAYVYMVLPVSGLFMLYYHLKQVIKWLR